jgi:hypothetical protein
MILDMIQGCSTYGGRRIDGLESWHGAGLLWNCSITITNTKGSYLYPGSNMTLSRPRLHIYYLKLTPWRHVRLVSIINSSPSLYPIRVITHSRMLPLSSVKQLFCRMTMYSRLQTPLPNALRKTSYRMVFFCQIRLTCQSIPCTNFWC